VTREKKRRYSRPYADQIRNLPRLTPTILPEKRLASALHLCGFPLLVARPWKCACFDLGSGHWLLGARAGDRYKASCRPVGGEQRSIEVSRTAPFKKLFRRFYA